MNDITLIVGDSQSLGSIFARLSKLLTAAGSFLCCFFLPHITPCTMAYVCMHTHTHTTHTCTHTCSHDTRIYTHVSTHHTPHTCTYTCLLVFQQSLPPSLSTCHFCLTESRWETMRLPSCSLNWPCTKPLLSPTSCLVHLALLLLSLTRHSPHSQSRTQICCLQRMVMTLASAMRTGECTLG